MANQAETGTKKVSTKKCSFTGCTRTKARFPSLHLFKFPVGRTSINAEWITNCGNDTLTSLPSKTLSGKVVCEKHFTEDSFTSLMRTQLKKDAVPTLLALDDANNESGEEGDLQDKTDTPPTDTVQRCDIDTSLATSLVFLTPTMVDTPLPQTTTSLATNTRPICSRRSLFTSSTPTRTSPQSTSDISTPQYKKLKSVKQRKATPAKSVTPVKKKLLAKLKDTIRAKRKYQQALKRLSAKKPKLSKDDIIQSIDAHLPKSVSSFFAMQINHANETRKPWSEEEKRQALTLRYKSPAMYDHMRREGFALPSRATIARWLQVVDLKPGICDDILKVIKTKADCMTSWEKKSVVMFDEMTIKSNLEYDSIGDLVEGLLDLGGLGRQPTPGTKVLLFMARGLVHRWKIPVAYFIVNASVTGDLVRKIIIMCISALQNGGLDIKAVVCDQSSTNRKAAKLLGINKDKPYFSCQDKKVYLIYDFPHVIKCVRNNLMKKDTKTGQLVGQISTDEGVADWSHIMSLYELDRSSSKARATKLTERHVAPNSFEKMSVKLATQVFSHSVSTAMQTAVDMNQLAPEGKDTASFLLRINNIFDAMNSKTKFHPNPHKCAVLESDNIHLKTPQKTIKKGIEWVKTWTMRNTSKRPPSFVGLEHSLNTTLLLWEDMKKEGVSYLLTGRLNHDPLENEFSIARQRCGYNRNPSARMFRQNLKHRILGALLKPPSGANCEPDEDYLLCDPSNLAQASTSTSASLTVTEEDADALCVEYSEHDDDDIEDKSFDSCDKSSNSSLEACAVRYFAGYAVRACWMKFKCETCASELAQAPTYASPDETLIMKRQYVTAAGEQCEGLVCPSELTTSVASITLTVFDRVFLKQLHIVGLKKKLLLKVKQWVNKEGREWSKCSSECRAHRSFVLDKIITAKLKRSLQETSKDMRQPGGKHSRFFKKVQNLQNK